MKFVNCKFLFWIGLWHNGYIIMCLTGTFGASTLEDRHLAVGDFDGKLEILDLAAADIPVYSVKAHDEIINTIDGVAGLNIGKGKCIVHYCRGSDWLIESDILFFILLIVNGEDL